MNWPWKKKRVLETISKLDLLDYLPHSKTDPLVFDRTYRLPTDDEVLHLLGNDYSLYDAEINDCDDYAFRAKGLASGRGWPFAVVWINGSHMINAWLNADREWMWLDPQNRKPYNGKIDVINAIII